MLFNIHYDKSDAKEFLNISEEKFKQHLNDLVNRFDELYSVSINVKTKTQEQIEEAQRNALPLDESDPNVQKFLEKIKKSNL